MADSSRDSSRRARIRPELERAIGLGLAMLAAFVAITCGSRGQLDGAQHAASPATISTTQTALPSAPGAAPVNGTALAQPQSSANPPAALPDLPSAQAADLVANDPSRLELPHFFANLSGLEKHTRKTPVRILWLGDSHTAADYLTGELRARLETRFGAGGPGFVRVGVKPYRHTQVHWACDGPWRVEPPQPSRRAPFDDGVFGLGGMRAFPGDAPSFAAFEVSQGTAHGQLAWQIWFSLAEGASFRLDLAGVSQVITPASAAAKDVLPGSGMSRISLSSALTDKLQLTTLSGQPRFYGLTVEGSEPGVVLDTVGIDGARVATALAWGEASFEAAVQARAPSLVALAFGTNEAFDADKVEKYRAEYHDLLTRVRHATPDADCLIVGPPDANAVSGGSEPRVIEIDALQHSVAAELGCGYLSQLEIMGGQGSYTKWANKLPPLARGDRLHLTPKGYESVADVMSQALLAAYDRSRNAPSK
jgi:lysophospholipase L1-like esterase